MTTFDAAWVAARELRRNASRSGLAMLGVVIGVAAIIAMVGLGNGATARVADQIARLGRNVVLIEPGSGSRGGVRLGWGTAAGLTIADAEAIASEIPGVDAVSPEIYTASQVTAGARNWNAKVYGESPAYFDIRQWPFAAGGGFQDPDVRAGRTVAVMGQTVRAQLFGETSPVGAVVRIGGIPFRVVGLLEPKGYSLEGRDQDSVLYVPYTTSIRRLLGKGTDLHRINVQAADEADLEEMAGDIRSLLRARHRLAPGAEDDFLVRTQDEITELATGTSRTMTYLLGALAGVSLIVGGIGIMNILLVSVSERTREIGIRMAVGARRRDVRKQFLVEALALSSAGGLIGVGAGIGAARGLSALADWPALVTAGSVLIAFLFSAGVGIFFGFVPARRASALDPIEALRDE